MNYDDKPFYIVYREYEFQKQKFHGILYLSDNLEDAVEKKMKLINIYNLMNQKVIIDIRTIHLKDTELIDMLEEIAEIGEITEEELTEKQPEKTPLFKGTKKQKVATSNEFLNFVKKILHGGEVNE